MPNKTIELNISGEGVASKKIEELDSAIEKWRSIVENRMALTESEVEAASCVKDLMHKHNITKHPCYVDDETRKIVTLLPKEMLKLEKDKSEDSAGEPEVQGD